MQSEIRQFGFELLIAPHIFPAHLRELFQIESMTKHGARLANLKETDCADLRRAILGAKDDSDMLWVLRWMGRPEHSEPAIYAELM